MKIDDLIKPLVERVMRRQMLEKVDLAIKRSVRSLRKSAFPNEVKTAFIKKARKDQKLRDALRWFKNNGVADLDLLFLERVANLVEEEELDLDSDFKIKSNKK